MKTLGVLLLVLAAAGCASNSTEGGATADEGYTKKCVTSGKSTGSRIKSRRCRNSEVADKSDSDSK